MSETARTIRRMGAWSAEPFGNDTAADWAYELEGQTDWNVVRDALRVAADTEGSQLDSDAATVAIAAAEVVARCLGRVPGRAFSDAVTAFVARASAPSAELASLADAAVVHATSDDGELAELWEDDPDRHAENERLRAALTTV